MPEAKPVKMQINTRRFRTFSRDNGFKGSSHSGNRGRVDSGLSSNHSAPSVAQAPHAPSRFLL